MNKIKNLVNRWGDMVLIDTWWNVNDEFQIGLIVGASVLIDTWWNVNN